MDSVSKFCPNCGAQQDIQKVNDEIPATVEEKTTEADFLSKLGLLSSSDQPKKPSIIPGFGQGANYKKDTNSSNTKKAQPVNISKAEKNAKAKEQQNAESEFFNNIFNNGSNKKEPKTDKSSDSSNPIEQKPIITEEYPKHKNNNDTLPISVVDINTEDIPVLYGNEEEKAENAPGIQFVDNAQPQIDDSLNDIKVVEVQSLDDINGAKRLPEQDEPTNAQESPKQNINVEPIAPVEQVEPVAAFPPTSLVKDAVPEIVPEVREVSEIPEIQEIPEVQNVQNDGVGIVENVPVVDIPVVDVPTIEAIPTIDNVPDMGNNIPVVAPVSTPKSSERPRTRISRAEMLKMGNAKKANGPAIKRDTSIETKDNKSNSSVGIKDASPKDIQEQSGTNKRKGLFGINRAAKQEQKQKEKIEEAPSRQKNVVANKTLDQTKKEPVRKTVSRKDLLNQNKPTENQQPTKQNVSSSAENQRPNAKTKQNQPKRKPTAERAKLLNKEVKKDIGDFYSNSTDSFLNLPEELPDEVADNAKDEESLRQNRQRKRVAEGRKAISDTRSRKRNFVTQKDVDSRKVEDIYHVDAEEEGYDNYYEDVLTIDHDFKQKRKIPFKEIGIILVALTALVIFAYFFLINNFDFD